VLKSLLDELGEKISASEEVKPQTSDFVIVSRKKQLSSTVSRADSLRLGSDNSVPGQRTSAGVVAAEEYHHKYMKKPSGEARITTKSGSMHKRSRSGLDPESKNKPLKETTETVRVASKRAEETALQAPARLQVPRVSTPSIPGAVVKATSRKVSFEGASQPKESKTPQFVFLKKPEEPQSAQNQRAIEIQAHQQPLEKDDLVFRDGLEFDVQDSDSDSLKKGSLNNIEDDLQEELLAAGFGQLPNQSLFHAVDRQADLTSSNLLLLHKLRNKSNLPDPVSFSEAILQLTSRLETAKDNSSLELSIIQQDHITEGTGSSPVNLQNRQSLNTAKKTSDKQLAPERRNYPAIFSAAPLPQPKPQRRSLLHPAEADPTGSHFLPQTSLDLLRSFEESRADLSRQTDSGISSGLKNTSLDDELNGENRFLRGIIDTLMKQNQDLQKKILQVHASKQEASSFGRSTVVSEQSSFSRGRPRGEPLQSSKVDSSSHIGFPSDKSISKPGNASPRKLTFDSTQPLESSAGSSPKRELNRSSKYIQINPSRFSIGERLRPEPIQASQLPQSGTGEDPRRRSSLLPASTDSPLRTMAAADPLQKTLKKLDSLSDNQVDLTLEKIDSPLRQRRVSSMSFSLDKGSTACSRKGDTSLMQKKHLKPNSLLLDKPKLRESFKGDSVTVVRTHTIESFNKKVCSSIRASLSSEKKEMVFELNAYIMAEEDLDCCGDQQQLKIINSVYREKEFFDIMCGLEQLYVDMSPNFMMINESIESLLSLLVVRFVDISVDRKAGTLKPFINTHPQVLWKSQVVRLHGNQYIANLVHNTQQRFWLVIKNTINQRYAFLRPG